MLIMVVVVVDGCEGVVGVMWGDGGWCGWRWSRDGVGVLAHCESCGLVVNARDIWWAVDLGSFGGSVFIGCFRSWVG
jgi:hypothetical protein